MLHQGISSKSCRILPAYRLGSCVQPACSISSLQRNAGWVLQRHSLPYGTQARHGCACGISFACLMGTCTHRHARGLQLLLVAKCVLCVCRGILFHGPPGTGKTLMARALAGACARASPKPITFFVRKGADCLGKFAGDAERTLRLLFQEVRLRNCRTPCKLCLSSTQ